MSQFTNINLELTTVCPLRCPQCYCSFQSVKHMNPEVAKYWIREAAAKGIRYIALSGGETMCYPYLEQIITCCKEAGLQSSAAFSGFGLTKETITRLIDAGLDTICISLNGSTEQINSRTRDGYHLAIHALELLREMGFSHTIINWVMHENNADDFPNMLALAEEYKVEMLDVISFKPDSKNQLESVPTPVQLRAVADQIRKHRGAVKIVVESCFSPLRALVCETGLFGNLNVGIGKGCRAGFSLVSINVDGLLAPCRHLYEYEAFRNLEDYWNNSPVLNQIRSARDDLRQPCAQCRYQPNCVHCLAINRLIHGEYYFGNQFCGLSESAK